MTDTTLVDIYEAAGGTVNEDRTMVTMDARSHEYFDILLRVRITGVEHDSYGNTNVTFGVIIDSKHIIDTSFGGALMSQIDYNEELTLPVEQVRIHKEARP